MRGKDREDNQVTQVDNQVTRQPGDRQNVYLQSRTNAETFCLVPKFLVPKFPNFPKFSP